MNYWVLSLPREAMQHCVDIGVFGCNRVNFAGQVLKGDKVVCYVTKECKFVGVGEATSDYYMDDSHVFKNTTAVFPDRFKFRAVIVSRAKQLPLKSILPDLVFIRKKAYWNAYLSSSINKITKEDWQLLSSLLG